MEEQLLPAILLMILEREVFAVRKVPLQIMTCSNILQDCILVHIHLCEMEMHVHQNILMEESPMVHIGMRCKVECKTSTMFIPIALMLRLNLVAANSQMPLCYQWNGLTTRSLFCLS